MMKHNLASSVDHVQCMCSYYVALVYEQVISVGLSLASTVTSTYLRMYICMVSLLRPFGAKAGRPSILSP